jgi:protein PhnA
VTKLTTTQQYFRVFFIFAPRKINYTMSIEKELHERSGSVCELCGGTDHLQVYRVPPASADADKSILVCRTCFEQINDSSKMDANHLRCLNNSMWSTVPAVQVMAWRILNTLRNEGWPQDLLDMLYLDDDTWRGQKQKTKQMT